MATPGNVSRARVFFSFFFLTSKKVKKWVALPELPRCHLSAYLRKHAKKGGNAGNA
jgi:hypothetical protein